ncbi:MAG TPA: hypothetical protein VN408_32880 [Actinoplanes sp.]|nr:hypothetical protein [Actinoplanes sp.]
MDESRWLPLQPGGDAVRQLLAASRSHRGLDCAGAEIAAADVRTALLSTESGLWIRAARITGRLDLRTCTVPVPLRFTSCDFTDPVDVEGAALHELIITGDATAARPAVLPGLHASGTRINRDLNLSGMVITGELRLPAARLGGSLDVTGAELTPADGHALDLAESTIGGSLLLNSPGTGRRCRIGGRIDMSNATIRGALLIRDADLTTLQAPRLTVHGTFRVDGETVIRGGILMPGAQLDGGMRLSGALWNPGGTALDLNQAVLGGFLNARGLSIEGVVRLNSARINGLLCLDHTTLTKPRRDRCVSAVNLTVTGDAQLRGLSAVGGSLTFRGASIAGVFDAQDAYVSNPGGPTVSLHMAQVTGNVRLCGRFQSIGRVVLTRAVIGGRLRADGATLTWKGDPGARTNAIDVNSAVIRGGVNLGWQVTAGAVNFTGASTSYLADRPDQDWPADSYVSGFTYERFEAAAWHGEAVWDATARIAWLSRMTRYDPRAWEQLAAVLRAAGDVDGAETVLIAQRRQARRLRTGRRRLFDRLQDTTVRYGFRPQRALYLLVALIAAVTAGLSLPAVQAQMRATDQNALVFTPAGAQPLPDEHLPPGECGNGKVRCLSPFFYAVDTVVPLIDLHQRSTWYPVAERNGVLLEWLLNLCTILGWIASTVFAVSFTRLGRAT